MSGEFTSPIMDNFNLPRKLTDAELAEIKAGKAREREIYTAAGWFIPIPSGRSLSPLGDKSEAYVNNGREILEQNQAELGGFIDLDQLEASDDLHDQAQEIEDLTVDNLVAPSNVSLIAGAAAKKLVDDEYNVLKGLEHLNTKWKAAVDRLSARCKGQGPQKKVAS